MGPASTLVKVGARCRRGRIKRHGHSHCGVKPTLNPRQNNPTVPVGIFSKRERGANATPDEWDSRDLPKPQTRIAFAAIKDSDSFGSRWKAWRKRLGLADTSAITMLADVRLKADKTKRPSGCGRSSGSI